jgi:hypothetical protein
MPPRTVGCTTRRAGMSRRWIVRRTTHVVDVTDARLCLKCSYPTWQVRSWSCSRAVSGLVRWHSLQFRSASLRMGKLAALRRGRHPAATTSPNEVSAECTLGSQEARPTVAAAVARSMMAWWRLTPALHRGQPISCLDVLMVTRDSAPAGRTSYKVSCIQLSVTASVCKRPSSRFARNSPRCTSGLVWAK